MTTRAVVLEPLVGQFLAHQRWFAGRGAPVEVVDAETLALGAAEVHWLLVAAGGATYQVLVGERPEAEALARLVGMEAAVIGRLPDGMLAYDALADPELALALLEMVSDGAERAERVRPVGGEQSNTSLIFDNRLIMKVFRRVQPGLNPDVEVSLALDEVGFNHVAAPVGNWRWKDYDLAIVRELLVGGSEGWALALTSLRDLCARAVVAPSTPASPSEESARAGGPEVGPEVVAAAGGDFGAEATRLGEMTAKLHLALAEGLGTEPGDTGSWAAEVSEQMLGAGLDPAATDELCSALRSVESPGLSIRVHGDYHLGQVMRTDLGWFVLDFEGEPTRPLSQRRRRRCALKDVAGMLRSFDYAAAVALRERGERGEEAADAAGLGRAWERRNRTAFLAGYLSTPRIGTILPASDAGFDTVLRAMEVEKAVYELAYERAYRPDWAPIPEAALGRLLSRPAAA